MSAPRAASSVATVSPTRLAPVMRTTRFAISIDYPRSTFYIPRSDRPKDPRWIHAASCAMMPGDAPEAACPPTAAGTAHRRPDRGWDHPAPAPGLGGGPRAPALVRERTLHLHVGRLRHRPDRHRHGQGP